MIYADRDQAAAMMAAAMMAAKMMAEGHQPVTHPADCQLKY